METKPDKLRAPHRFPLRFWDGGRPHHLPVSENDALLKERWAGTHTQIIDPPSSRKFARRNLATALYRGRGSRAGEAGNKRFAVWPRPFQTRLPIETLEEINEEIKERL